MDGKTLTAIFEDEKSPDFISSWEEQDYQATLSSEHPENDSDLIRQLVDLGYIEDPGKNDEEAGVKTLSDNKFYLARAYIDGNKYHEAVKILEDLFREDPNQVRFAASLCNCYQKLLKDDQVDETIAVYKKALLKKYEEGKASATEKNKRLPEFKIPDAVSVMEATSLMSRFRAKDALSILNSISNEKGTGKIYLRKGLCHVMLNDFENAIAEFEKELGYNYDEPEAHHGIGYCLLKQRNYDEAIEHFLNAIGLRFNYTVAHFHLAECFFNLEQFENAKQAYEVCLKMEPGMNRARLRIAKIYKEHLNDAGAEADILNDIPKNISDTIYIVSGLPRSGTSLMMQMLAAGGMEIFTDGKRSADESNPRGYYEHEAVLRIKRDTGWLNQAVNKVVKIVSPLLRSLPPRYYYKIIFMERDILEVMASQQMMLKNYGKKEDAKFSLNIMDRFKENLQQISEWEETNKNNVEILRITYRDLVNNPEVFIGSIKNFTNMNLDERKMEAVIDKSLHRIKNEDKNYNQLT